MQELIQTAQFEQQTFHRNSRNTLEKLKKLKGYYGRLWKINVQVNERFDWTICVVLTVYFYTISISIYWVFLRFQLKLWDSMWRKWNSLNLKMNIIVHKE